MPTWLTDPTLLLAGVVLVTMQFLAALPWLWAIDPKVYRVFNDLVLPRPDGKGTTQIDHVVVSPFG